MNDDRKASKALMQSAFSYYGSRTATAKGLHVPVTLVDKMLTTSPSRLTDSDTALLNYGFSKQDRSTKDKINYIDDALHGRFSPKQVKSILEGKGKDKEGKEKVMKRSEIALVRGDNLYKALKKMEDKRYSKDKTSDIWKYIRLSGNY